MDWKAIKEAASPDGWMPSEGVAPTREQLTARMSPQERERRSAFWKGFGGHFKEGQSYMDLLRTFGAMATRGALKSPMLPYATWSYPVSWFGNGVNWLNLKRGRVTPAQYEWTWQTNNLVNAPVEWWDRHVTSRGMDYPESVMENGASSLLTGLGEDLTGGYAVGKALSALKNMKSRANLKNEVSGRVQERAPNEMPNRAFVDADYHPLDDPYRTVDVRGVSPVRHNTRQRVWDMRPVSKEKYLDLQSTWFKDDPVGFQKFLSSEAGRNMDKSFKLGDPWLLGERLRSYGNNNILAKKRFVDQTRNFARTRSSGNAWESIKTPQQAEAFLNRYFGQEGSMRRKFETVREFLGQSPSGDVGQWYKNKLYREAVRNKRISSILGMNNDPVPLTRALGEMGKGDFFYKGWKKPYPDVDTAMGFGSMGGAKASAGTPRWGSVLAEVPIAGGSYIKRGGSFGAVRIPRNMRSRILSKSTPHVSTFARSPEELAELKSMSPVNGQRYRSLSASPDYEVALPWENVRELLDTSPQKKMFRIVDYSDLLKDLPGRLRTDPVPKQLRNVLVKEVKPSRGVLKTSLPHTRYSAPYNAANKLIGAGTDRAVKKEQ